MNHPTTAGLYMFMLCYKNGSLAREHIRDALNNSSSSDTSWELFNKTALNAPPLNQQNPDSDPMQLGLYFPRPEIVPNVPAGEWHYEYNPKTNELRQSDSKAAKKDKETAKHHARSIVESQFLSLRLRSHNLIHPPNKPDSKSNDNNDTSALPPQPRRVYLVGGASVNPAIASLAGQVLGGSEGIYRLDIGGNACALGAAYRAVWAVERSKGESFEELVGKRWSEEEFVKKVDQGYRKGVFERYGEAVRGFAMMEEEVVKACGRGGGRGSGKEVDGEEVASAAEKAGNEREG